MSLQNATRAPVPLSLASKQWMAGLQPGAPRHEETVARLRELLVRVAAHELGRRRPQLGSVSGPEFDDLVEQAASDAVLAILDKLDTFQGLSQFTTWAYKFAMFQVSAKVSAHAWQRHPPAAVELEFDRLPDTLEPSPGGQVERREQLAALADGIRRLSDRQRQVFVAIALNDVPMDVLARQLGSNRNAIYKNLFDARRRLREHLAAAGHPIAGEDPA